jgi:beta-lactamase class A
MFPIEEFIAQFRDKTIALSVHDLRTGREINLRADGSFHPASTIKVHVMMEVFHQTEQGTSSLEEQVLIHNSFTSLADGSPFSLDVKDDSDTSLYGRIGQTESIRELTRLMIVRSGNLATNILLEKVGAKNVNSFIETLGIRGVAVRRGVEDNAAFRKGMNNSATARGLTQTMHAIAEGRVVSKKSSDDMIQIMLGQEFNESIPALLPKQVKAAHKTGWTGEFYHDTGIVYPEDRKPYAISIMTRGFAENKEEEAHKCMAQISRMVYEELT